MSLHQFYWGDEPMEALATSLCFPLSGVWLKTERRPQESLTQGSTVALTTREKRNAPPREAST